MLRFIGTGLTAAAFVASAAVALAAEVAYYPVVKGSRPHDVWPAADGGVWYSGQHNGTLGHLDPKTGKVTEIKLPEKAAPHSVMVARDGGVWLADGGLNAMVRYDPASKAIKLFKLPADSGYTNMNTAVEGNDGRIWFTGQSGIYGVVDPRSGDLKIWKAPKGRGPYGITVTPDGRVFYVSLAGSFLGEIDAATGATKVIEPPTPNQGARRVWSDSKGLLWISEWNSGNLSRYDPKTGAWKMWRPPGEKPRTYSVYVDEEDQIWLTDFNANSIVRFDPVTEKFTSYKSNLDGAQVRQMAGRRGEAWGAESGNERLVVVRFDRKS
jgi:virginiamycin B lyase